MKNNEILTQILIILFFIQFDSIAQSYGTGALLDDQKFITSRKSPPLTRGDFIKLPSKYSLKEYSPTPGDQGGSSTCTGWSISYGARTILEAISNQWSTNEINANTFSPSYVYNQIRSQDGCDFGTSLVDGLEIITNEGVLPYTEFGYDCEREVNNDEKARASSFKLKEYREIVSRQSKNKTLNIKKSLTQSNPVVIGINCPKSLYSAKDVWHPKKDEYNKNINGHALTVIGFDDNVEGGAFEILNSWGVQWGNNGFIWMRYSDIEHFSVWGAELIAEKKNIDHYNINADIFLREYQSNIIDFKRNINSYETADTFLTGTKFQLYLTNKSPSFLYILSYDAKKGTQCLFPITPLMSDYLAYSENNIILPSEEHAFELDDDSGLSSLVILLSTQSIREELDEFINASSKHSKLNELIKKMSSDERKVSFESEITDKNIITLSKKNVNHFITMVKLDIFHVSKEEE